MEGISQERWGAAGYRTAVERWGEKTKGLPYRPRTVHEAGRKKHGLRGVAGVVSGLGLDGAQDLLQHGADELEQRERLEKVLMKGRVARTVGGPAGEACQCAGGPRSAWRGS